MNINLVVAIILYGIWGFIPKLATKSIDIYNMVIYDMIGHVLIAFLFLYLFKFQIIFNISGSLLLILTGCIGTVATYFLYKALITTSATVVAASIALYPAITMLLSVLFLQETVTIQKIFGIILAIIAVILLN